MSDNKNMKKLRHKFENDTILVKLDNFKPYSVFNANNTEKISLKKTSAWHVFQWLGKNHVNEKNVSLQHLTYASTKFLDNILNIEKEENKNARNKNKDYLSIRDIHNIETFYSTIKAFTFIFAFPLIFLLSTKINSLGTFKYLFLVPSCYALYEIRKDLKYYITCKNAIFMLYLIDQQYDKNSEIYRRYINFMKDENFEFQSIKKL